MARHASTILCLAVAALVALGLVMLASTSAWVRGVEDPYHFLSRQTLMVVLGLIAAGLCVWVKGDLVRRLAPAMYFIACALLVMCFVPGVAAPELGSNRWIKFPVIGRFQPSEMAKIIVIICLASWFARWQTEVRSFWRGFVLPGLITAIPLGLIAVETDVGSAITLSLAVAALFFCVGTRLLYTVPTGLLAIAGGAWFVMNDPVRWKRIEAWLDLENPAHALGTNMQQIRALYALGNGGPTGVGLGNGNEKFGTLTYAHIDFIAANIGEELGLVAMLGVIFAFVLIAVGGIAITLQARDMFHRCLALGLTCLLVVPALQNIAVVTAVIPNDGLPLPFVSYGGTSLILSLAAVGMLVGIHRRSHVRVIEAYPLERQTQLAVRL
jgi:cell division protein FtsW